MILLLLLRGDFFYHTFLISSEVVSDFVDRELFLVEFCVL
jgi:hypothetical protein